MGKEHSAIVPEMQPTAKVADFKFWCQKVLPLVYDDSLSYYEVLNKMVVYLNQVINNVNADNDNVESCKAAFLELQDYVNNFFDDIDQLVSYAERAESAETSAIGYAASAAESASNSATSASNAAGSASTAASMATSALNAKDAAVAAKTAAEAALVSAQTAATEAASSSTSAAGSAINAQASASAASNNATLATTAAQTAVSKANEASQSATAAAGSAEDAADSAADAATAAATADGAKAQAMIATQESTTATGSHNIGDYFRIDGVLYKATADIQIGDTISTDTNCQVAVLADDVSSQSEAIDELAYNKNILNVNVGYIGSKYINGRTVGNTITLANSSSSNVFKASAYVKKNRTYTFTYIGDSVSGTRRGVICDETEKVLEVPLTYTNTNKATFTPTVNGYLWLEVPKNVTGIMLVQGENTIDYVPYIDGLFGFSQNGEGFKAERTAPLYMILKSKTVKSIAHRGDQIDAPKNTAPAYITARRLGFDIAENDVAISADNQFVMWHDPTLSILDGMYDINGYEMYVDGSNNAYWYDNANSTLYTWSGNTYVESGVVVSTLTRANGSNYSTEDFPLQTLKRIDFGRWKGVARFKGTQILTFEEWVLLCKQLGMELYIDHKVVLDQAMINSLVSVLKKYGMLDKASWIVNQTQAQYLRTADPNARILVLANPTSENIATWMTYVGTGRGIAFDGPFSGLAAEAVELGISAGFDVGCYYVDYGDATEETIISNIKRAVNMGITEITVDKYSVEYVFKEMLELYL